MDLGRNKIKRCSSEILYGLTLKRRVYLSIQVGCDLGLAGTGVLWYFTFVTTIDFQFNKILSNLRRLLESDMWLKL